VQTLEDVKIISLWSRSELIRFPFTVDVNMKRSEAVKTNRKYMLQELARNFQSRDVVDDVTRLRLFMSNSE